MCNMNSITIIIFVSTDLSIVIIKFNNRITSRLNHKFINNHKLNNRNTYHINPKFINRNPKFIK